MTSGELGRLEFIAALGDSQSVMVMLDGVNWMNAAGRVLNVTDTLLSGEFDLIGLCPNGGSRMARRGSS